MAVIVSRVVETLEQVDSITQRSNTVLAVGRNVSIANRGQQHVSICLIVVLMQLL